MIKQVIIVRTDLRMGMGKMGAQIGHASTGVFFKSMDNVMSFDGGEVVKSAILHENEAMRIWRLGAKTNGKKVVVGCNSEYQLLALQKKAEEAGIVNCLVKDSGTTFFKQDCPNCNGTGWLNILECARCHGTGKIPKPTYTVLAIGPDYTELINPITKRLRLL